MKDIIRESKSMTDNSHNYKKYIVIAAFLSIFACMAVLAIPGIHEKVNSSEQSGGTLPGAEKIYPAVMCKGRVYNWKRMAGPENKLPQGELPGGYEYVGDIEYNDTGKLVKDFQFTAVFNASGKLYFNADEPNNVCICITTDWLSDAYVIFQFNEDR
ncbi:MAG: hypothetical protein Q8930_13255 [Bacillota bacterium]|nr:hypothetical protein [Bacillota bacterium]